MRVGAIFKIFMSIFRKNKVKTCILETFGVKQGANTSFKKFLTEARGNFFIFGSYWVGQGVIFLFNFMNFFFWQKQGVNFWLSKFLGGDKW